MQTLKRPFGTKGTGPVEAFKEHGADFVVRDNIEDLVRGMNELSRGDDLLDPADIRRQIEGRDRELDKRLHKGLPGNGHAQRPAFYGDKIVRTAKPHRILDPAHGPLIAVRLNILTRKTLGGLETDLEARVLNEQGEAVPGLYAVGKQPALAAVACTATGRWKAPSWAAACSQGVMPGVPRRRPLFRGLWFRFAEQAPLLSVSMAPPLST